METPYTATHANSLGTTVYSLVAASATDFEIDSTGQLKTKTVFDYETPPTTYSVSVSVTDSKDISGNTDGTPTEDATIDVTINVTNIDVPDVPGQPTVTAAKGAAAKLNVTWTAIAATSSAPVDGYDVQFRERDATPADTRTQVSVTTNSATITTGLEYSKT